ncbi:uncharacterized protein LOC130138937 [Syzygium oleosum]|uniref:uncharacterized protein LOC130138937 n=1 Tax=Syzygium oleosum TaxID=219896 RepID=UPI0024B99229|nr:uncharacterized protein LOC130138937 [Syzygium oleosum]
MEGIFRTDRVPNDRKVDFATQCLEGEAEYWWEGTRLALGGEDTTISWEDFTKAFNTQFFPRSFQAKMRDDFIHISQSDSTVMDYAGRFNQLSRFAKHYVDDEELKAEHFQRGLRLNIRSKLAPLELATYKDVLERAIKVERYKLERDTQGVHQQKRPKFTEFQGSRECASYAGKRDTYGVIVLHRGILHLIIEHVIYVDNEDT